MSNQYPPSGDEPTLPAGPAPYYSQQRNHQPYQYPPSSGPGQAQGSYPMHQGQMPVYQPTTPIEYTPPAQRQMPGVESPRRRPRRRRGRTIGCLSTLVIVLVLAILLFVTGQKVLAFGSAISTQSPLTTQTGYVGGSERINFLIMGYGGSGHDGAYLTDSLVIISLLPQSHHTTLISIPRDLWVQNPAGSGNYTKLNAVYPVAAGNTNSDPVAGGNAVAQKISVITGLQVNYWMTINFNGFKDFIDAIGGVDVNVPDGFTANYPANDDPAINPNWMKVKFTAGQQHMDGARAIIYARARYVIDNPAEGTDFARSARQQLIMKAALAKLKAWQTWPQLFNAMDKLKNTLYSNLSLADLAQFALKMDLNDAHRVGLSTSNVLGNATSNDGQSILQPLNGDWNQIPPYIKKQLYN
ncbi:MAG TPA: LCP family protein [Ktedonobacteraceae bacterium]|nr:LCP family protein [Ktedonobacteraceae bacterium]